MRKSSTAIWISWVGLAVVSVGLSSELPASDDRHPDLRQAIDAVRGVNYAALDEAQREELGKRLDAAWQTLMDRPKPAKMLIREALDKETDDHFFILDLGYLYLGLDHHQGDVEQVSRWILKADPAAYPSRFFDITSGMASLRCEACRPAVLRMLELEELEASIQAHALPIDLILGLLFTVVSYGDLIMPELSARLTAAECAVRSNAAVAIGLLLPSEYPKRIAEIAASDPCERARTGAMHSLAVADPPALVRLVDTRMESVPAPGSSELLAFVEALVLAPPRLAVSPLEKLSRAGEPGVAEAAREALDALGQAGSSEAVPRLFSSGDAAARSGLIQELTAAIEKSRFEYDGSPSDILAAMKPEDYSLLNDARRAVLRRLSDECLYEFRTLHAATLMVREALRAAPDVE